MMWRYNREWTVWDSVSEGFENPFHLRNAIPAFFFHDFWTQVAIVALMTYMARTGHDFCCGGNNVDNIPCDDCGAGY